MSKNDQLNELKSLIQTRTLSSEIIRKIESLIENGFDINEKDDKDRTVFHYFLDHYFFNHYLHHAGMPRYIEKVEFFINKGADINIADAENITPIKIAVKSKYSELILFLTKKWIEDFKKNNPNKTPSETLEELTSFLEVNEINLDVPGKWKSILHYSTKTEYIDIVEILMQAHIKISEKRQKDLSFVRKITEFFISDRVKLNIRDYNLSTPLHDAAKNNNIKMAEILIKNGAKVNTLDSNWKTPLDYATDEEIKKYLKDNIRAKIWLKSKELIKSVILYFEEKIQEVISGLERDDILDQLNFPRFSKIHSQILAGSESLTRFEMMIKDQNMSTEQIINILEFDSKLFAKDPKKIIGFLYYAIFSISWPEGQNRTPLILYLAKKQKDFNKDLNIIPEYYKETILYHAALYGNKEIVEYLINNGADINFKTANGDTLLHAAAENNSVTNFKEITEFLIKAGLDINAVDNNKHAPSHAIFYDYSNFSTIKEKIEFLVNHTKLDIKTNLDQTLFHIIYRLDRLKDNDIIEFKEITEFLVNNGLDINASDKQGKTPLYYASLYYATKHDFAKYEQIIEILIANGADINAQNTQGKTSLHYALRNYYSTRPAKREKIEFLINKGADINISDQKNIIPIKRIVKERDQELILFLIKKLLKDQKEKNPNQIITENLEEVISFLRKNKIDFDMKDQHSGKTLLHYAIQEEHKDIAEILMQIFEKDGQNPSFSRKVKAFFMPNKTAPNIQDKLGKTPLHYAAKSGNIKMAEILIKNGAKLNIKDNNGKTPLDYIKNQDTKKFLRETEEVAKKENNIFKKIQNYIKDKAETSTITSPQLIAQDSSQNASDKLNILKNLIKDPTISIETIIKEIESESKLLAENQNWLTDLLCYAVQHKNEEIVEYLINHGANINAQDNQGKTPLYYALISRYSIIPAQYREKIEFLINKGADINISDQDGNIPIKMIVKERDQELILFLIKKLLKDQKEKNPNQIITENLEEVISFLRKNQINFDMKDQYSGKTLLHYAVQKEHKDIAEILTQIFEKHRENLSFFRKIKEFFTPDKAMQNIQNYRGETPLHYAVINDDIEKVKYLVENGAKLDLQDSARKTPLDHSKNEEITKYLKEAGELAKKKMNIFKKIWIKTEEIMKSATSYFKGKSYKPTKIHKNNLITEVEDKLPKLKNLIYDKKISIDDIIKAIESESKLLTENQIIDLLYYAAQYGNKEIVKYLIGRKPDINFRNMNGETLLHAAAKNDSITDFKEITEILIEAGIDINAADNNKYTPLYVIFRSYQNTNLIAMKEKINFLVTHKADINFKTKNGTTLLHYAAKQNYIKGAEILIEAGIDINVIDDKKNTPLYLVFNQPHFFVSHEEITKWFVDHGADVNAMNDNQATILYGAIRFDYEETVKFLVEEGAKLDVKTKNGQTLLHAVCLRRDDIDEEGVIRFEKIAKFLIDSKVIDINAEDEGGKTAFHYFVKNAHYFKANQYEAHIKLFIDSGANINAKDKNGQTPLYNVIQNNRIDDDFPQQIKILIDNGADINIAAKDGSTPIKMAVKREDQEAILILIKKWIENLKEKNPDKTLAENIEEMALFLKENQINFDIHNPENLRNTKTISHYAAQKEYKDIVEILMGAFIKISEKDRQNTTFSYKIKEFFMPHKATQNIQDNWGKTPLHYAVESKNLKMAEILIKNGAKLNIKDHYENTPLNYAKNAETAKFLREIEKENNIFGKIWAKTKGIIKSAILSFKEKLSSKTSVKTEIQTGNNTSEQTPASPSHKLPTQNFSEKIR